MRIFVGRSVRGFPQQYAMTFNVLGVFDRYATGAGRCQERICCGELQVSILGAGATALTLAEAE